MIDIIIGVFAGAIVVFAIAKTIKDKKENKGCANCSCCRHNSCCKKTKK